MKMLAEYLKKNRRILIYVAFLWISQGIILYLYDIPMENVLYVGAIWLLGTLAAFGWGFYSYRKKLAVLIYMRENLKEGLAALPQPSDHAEEVYQQMLQELAEDRRISENNQKKQFDQLNDYYTMWVHQIKTPIAATRLLLQEDGNQEVLAEIFRIEQYVEMVLGYLRVQDMAADMDFVTCSLDGIIRDQIHKYARSFIKKKNALKYDGVDEKVLTDKKWLGFVIGQIFSNALKYTKNGTISVYMSESRPHTLVIQDTGEGIRKEDLPRIFEKGFTGHNGRNEIGATGIGLYLCAKIMKKLDHGISVESEPGQGTRVFLSFDHRVLDIY